MKSRKYVVLIVALILSSCSTMIDQMVKQTEPGIRNAMGLAVLCQQYFISNNLWPEDIVEIEKFATASDSLKTIFTSIASQLKSAEFVVFKKDSLKVDFEFLPSTDSTWMKVSGRFTLLPTNHLVFDSTTVRNISIEIK